MGSLVGSPGGIGRGSSAAPPEASADARPCRPGPSIFSAAGQMRGVRLECARPSHMVGHWQWRKGVSI